MIDQIIVDELNPVEDMPYQYSVDCVLKGEKHFTECFRIAKWETCPGAESEFWLEDECKHVQADEIEGWINSPIYQPKKVNIVDAVLKNGVV